MIFHANGMQAIEILEVNHHKYDWLFVWWLLGSSPSGVTDGETEQQPILQERRNTIGIVWLLISRIVLCPTPNIVCNT
jgi:hypothetical protein